MSRKRKRTSEREEPKDNLHSVSSLIITVFIMLAAYQYIDVDRPSPSVNTYKSSILPTGHASVYRCSLYGGYAERYCAPETYNREYCYRYSQWVGEYCDPSCGNNVVEEGEECDGDAFRVIDSCADYTHFTGGSLTCASDCTLDTSECTAFLS